MQASDGGWGLVPYSSYVTSTPALPAFYWDVYSSEQRIKHICYEIDKVINYADMLGVNLNVTHEDVLKLQSDFEKFKESGFADYYEKQFEQWFEDNFNEIYERMVRSVYFGLTLDGYFVAYVPESWSDIEFDTGAVYVLDTYGRLILRFDVDSPYNVDQTPDYSEDSMMLRVDTIETTANNAMALSETNEKDISSNDGDIASINIEITSLDSRVTALEDKQ